MSSESQIFRSRAAIMAQFWRAFAVASAATAGAAGLGLLIGAVPGWLRWPTRLVALASLVLCLIRWSDAAEYLAKAKGIYHPMYGVLGPLGLLMVVLTRSTNKS
ncbi:hypothetical protein GCM10009630_42480 [Kribbella jejuensis]|uniref:Uncharacterized protein n=1 Tax=Kribbella jejuensis TaxID=236068 RepID=A0A542EQA8_9ACTN|nr:hypothetical protein [Kribbella jejuensis]TQJ17531.1 hypothetical protein FB475_1651 [Kribbella jejuensis]